MPSKRVSVEARRRGTAREGWREMEVQREKRGREGREEREIRRENEEEKGFTLSSRISLQQIVKTEKENYFSLSLFSHSILSSLAFLSLLPQSPLLLELANYLSLLLTPSSSQSLRLLSRAQVGACLCFACEIRRLSHERRRRRLQHRDHRVMKSAGVKEDFEDSV